MPFAFAPSNTQPGSGYVTGIDLPLNEWMGVKFGQFAHDTIWSAGQRAIEDYIWDDDNKLRPDVANEVWGIPGHLKFDQPISIQRARLMRERKEAELLRMSYLNSATHSWVSPRAAVGTLAGMVGAVANPVDFAALFIPFVGSTAKATLAAKAGQGAFRQALQRGLIPIEEIATATRFGSRFPLFTASVINGTFGNAVTEVPVFIQNVRDQAVYGPADAALNIAAGGVFGGAFHVAGAAIKKALSPAAIGKALSRAEKAYRRLNPETQEGMLAKAANDALENKVINVDDHAATDMATVRADVIFDEASARRRALEDIGVLPEEAQARAILETVNRGRTSALDLLDMARAHSERGNPDSAITARLIERFKSGERSVDLMTQIADFFGLRYDPMAPTLQERLKADALFDQKPSSLASDFKAARRELFEVDSLITRTLNDLAKTTDDSIRQRLLKNLESLNEEKNRLVEEVKRFNETIKASSALTPDEIAKHSEEIAKRGLLNDDQDIVLARQLEARAEEVRNDRLLSALERERALWQAEVDGTARKQFEAKLRADINAGKILSDEQVKKLSVDVADEGTMTLIKEQIASLTADAKKMAAEDSPLAKQFAKELEEALADPEDISKAYDEAAKCVARLIE